MTFLWHFSAIYECCVLMFFFKLLNNNWTPEVAAVSLKTRPVMNPTTNCSFLFALFCSLKVNDLWLKWLKCWSFCRVFVFWYKEISSKLPKQHYTLIIVLSYSNIIWFNKNLQMPRTNLTFSMRIRIQVQKIVSKNSELSQRLNYRKSQKIVVRSALDTMF